MVYRLFVEKKEGFRIAEEALLSDLKQVVGIAGLQGVRLFNRYDIQGIDASLLEQCKHTVFCEVQVDTLYETFPLMPFDAFIVAVEYLPGQFDQRSDSAAQCIQLISTNERPLIRSAKVYCLQGVLSQEDKMKIKEYLINPVESREADLDLPLDLLLASDEPEQVSIIDGFIDLDDRDLEAFHCKESLAMDVADLNMVHAYFQAQKRNPTYTELKVIDTYWSDHCRHTTFLTSIDSVQIEDEEIQQTYKRYLSYREALGTRKSVTLMDLATLGAKVLKREGRLDNLDESDEINACSVKVKVDHDGKREPWLLLFKNETHNHPTEIEPFGGAATCIGGAIRDPLSGRGYVYQAMRISGASDPLSVVDPPLVGKIPQRKLVTTAANGNSSYGNQIGLATGLVEEIYHPGFIAKHMELGAVVGAVPLSHVRREQPLPGDKVVLVGGRTGRDGCGGATGSSKSHDLSSLSTCGAEVQKGNAPEERKLQRLMRNPEATLLIKRCNDFGAGGVSVAIGELAPGLVIDLDAIPTKYEGLDGTTLAISESQERMAVVLDDQDVAAFINLAAQENLEATVVATVTQKDSLVMYHQHQKIVDLERSFLDTNGAEKHTSVSIPKREHVLDAHAQQDTAGRLLDMLSDLNVCSKQGLSERFDSTIGGGTLFMPFGGTYQKTPSQVMAALFPVLDMKTTTSSVMSWGYDPFLMEKDPYQGAFLAVTHSIAKLVASGADLDQVYLTFQEYFGKVGSDPKRWGLPFAALLGAFKAQMLFGKASIGGKDSMSGSFGSLDVPPTLVSFAISASSTEHLISGEFKQAGHPVVLVQAEGEEDLPRLFEEVQALIRSKSVASCYALGFGGIAEAVVKMCLGNRIGCTLQGDVDLFAKRYGAFVLELTKDSEVGQLVGYTHEEATCCGNGFSFSLDALQAVYEQKLAPIYPIQNKQEAQHLCVPTLTYEKPGKRKSFSPCTRPKVLIPVFPGTNCEYDLQRALIEVGAESEIFVINNLSPQGVSDSVDRFAALLASSQILFLPGGFSGGDEPDGSGKFIASFLRNPHIAEEITRLLDVRDGLVCGVCNGFQALVKLGLLPYGKITSPSEDSPTLTFNTLARHQSMLVRSHVSSVLSPWMSAYQVGDVSLVPISHGEGRFVCKPALLDELARSGQIACQYVDLQGAATLDLPYNPNGSDYAVEALSSADGRIFGRMAHSERGTRELYLNTPYKPDNGLFRGAVHYFS